MSDPLDQTLLAHFARAADTTLDDQFMSALLARLEAERRQRLKRQAAIVAAVLLLLVWQSPALLALSVRIAEGVVAKIIVPALPVASAGGLSAAGWSVSLLIGALVLWRTPSLRRR